MYKTVAHHPMTVTILYLDSRDFSIVRSQCVLSMPARVIYVFGGVLVLLWAKETSSQRVAKALHGGQKPKQVVVITRRKLSLMRADIRRKVQDFKDQSDLALNVGSQLSQYCISSFKPFYSSCVNALA